MPRQRSPKPYRRKKAKRTVKTEDMWADYQAGLTLAGLCEKYQMARNTITVRFNKAGLVRRPRGKRPRSLEPQPASPEPPDTPLGRIGERRTLDAITHKVGTEMVDELTEGKYGAGDMLAASEFEAAVGISDLELLLCDERHTRRLEKLRRDCERRDMSPLMGVIRTIVAETRFKLAQNPDATPAERAKACDEIDRATKSYGEVGVLIDLDGATDEELAVIIGGIEPDSPEGRVALELCPDFATVMGRPPRVSALSADSTGASDEDLRDFYASDPEHKRIIDEWRFAQEEDVA